MTDFRVLQILPGGRVCGGIENFIMNYYREMVKIGVQFDFLVHYDEIGYYDDEIKSLGGRIYYCNVRRDKNIIKYLYFLFRFFKEHKEYKIIHGHMPGMAPLYFIVAKIFGVKNRISHCHVTDTEPTIKGRILEFIIKSIPFFSNVYFSCSIMAGKYMYGKRNFTVIHNAINVDKYSYNKKNRQNIREELGIHNCFVVGNVARFNIQKNHEFLIDVFFEIKKILPSSILLLLGEGPLEEEVKSKCKALGIEKSCIFLGMKEDVYRYYSAMDCFVLPSLFEGLTIVGVEAQAAGLNTFVSDSSTPELNITSLVHFLSLKEGPEYWAKYIIKYHMNDRREDNSMITTGGYNIKNESEKLKDYYKEMVNSLNE